MIATGEGGAVHWGLEAVLRWWGALAGLPDHQLCERLIKNQAMALCHMLLPRRPVTFCSTFSSPFSSINVTWSMRSRKPWITWLACWASRHIKISGHSHKSFAGLKPIWRQSCSEGTRLDNSRIICPYLWLGQNLKHLFFVFFCHFVG